MTAAPVHEEPTSGFAVHLEEFSGPFDVLLQMISKHKLEVTELSLSQVTDEFVQYIRQQGQAWDLEEASHFLVVAATLLDLKVVKLLPGAELEDEEDLALLEARDLLFARLMQYRAYKDVSATFAQMLADAPLMQPRTVGLDPDLRGLLPDVILGFGPDAFAALAAVALTPKPVPEVATDHIHAHHVNVAEQKEILFGRLRECRQATFRELIEDADNRMVVVGRFLALLELFRDGTVRFEQERALAELTIVWEDDSDRSGD
ncbi:MAG TPA: segregation/condensation protein A [Actinomycetota bacterium]|nr:segregation/condensation protein A [Actinomycetota bacterium]